jgi:hypothetical protein
MDSWLRYRECKQHAFRACLGLRLQTPNVRLKHQKPVSAKKLSFGKMVVKVLLKFQTFKPTFEHKLNNEAFDQTGD